jgi:xanthine dehydrogenase accessory factor
MVTVIRTSGSAPRKIGAKMIVDGDGKTVGTIGGGELEKCVVEATIDVLVKGEPRLISFTLDGDKGEMDMMCGGEIEFYLDPIMSSGRSVVFGAGYITRALAPLMQGVGFRVSVIDDSPELLQADAFPGMEGLLLNDMKLVTRDLTPVPDTYVVLLSRGFSRDKTVLRSLLERGTLA